MSILYLEPWLTLGLTPLSLALLLQLGHFPGWLPTPPPTQHRSPRPLRPRTPDDCPFCRQTSEPPAGATPVVPYAQRKSPRGCKTRSASTPRATPVPIRIAPISTSGAAGNRVIWAAAGGFGGLIQAAGAQRSGSAAGRLPAMRCHRLLDHLTHAHSASVWQLDYRRPYQLETVAQPRAGSQTGVSRHQTAREPGR